MGIPNFRSRYDVSSIAYSLALRVASAKKKVLLVEFNLSNPYMSDFFKLKDIWQNDKNLNDNIHNIENTELSIIPAPNTLNIPVFILEKDLMKPIFNSLLEQYDHIIIDSSYIGNSQQYNVPIEVIGYIADYLLLVVATGVLREEEVWHAKNKLKKFNLEISGTIINEYKNYRLIDQIEKILKIVKRVIPYSSKACNSIYNILKRMQDCM